MLVIIHGWSDTHQSLANLGRRLVDKGVIRNVAHIRLGDYISLDDNITFNDLIYALESAWKKENLPTGPRSIDIIVHSTGALVIRHWMTTFFKPSTNPIKRLLMLAPANFGSPLAHKGRSFLGRAIKGFKSSRPFETGTHILKGLELGSPFTWELAKRDRFGDETWYGPEKVLCTVLVGTSGYTGISAAANEVGTDGTVRVSTANLNPALATLDFSVTPDNPTISFSDAKGQTAFARLSGENHSTILMNEKEPQNENTFEFIKQALTVEDSEFPKFIEDLESFSDKERIGGSHRAFTQSYQNTVIRLKDNEDRLVSDYFLEVFAKDRSERRVDDELTRLIQEDAITTVHAYGDNAAYRSMLFNVANLLDVAQDVAAINMSIAAMPDIRKTKTVGYSTFGYNDIGSIRLSGDLIPRVFQSDRTMLVDIKIRRERTEKVFRLLNLE